MGQAYSFSELSVICLVDGAYVYMYRGIESGSHVQEKVDSLRIRWNTLNVQLKGGSVRVQLFSNLQKNFIVTDL